MPWNGLTREDLATIVHTSGATGQPKGALLSHGNVVAECEEAEQAMPLGETDEALSTLPLSHMAERAGGQFVPLAIGAGVTFAEPVMERWISNLSEVRPTVMLSVPPFEGERTEASA